MDFLGHVIFWGFIIGIVIYKIGQSIEDGEKKRKEEELRHTNPAVYVQLKQMEHEREIMAHDQERMKHEKVRAGAGFFAELVRIFTK